MSVPTEVPVDDEGEVAPEPASEDGRGGHPVAVVTGASRGIGRFVADALEDAGYAVERGSSAVAPVTDRAALTAWVDEVVERHGRIDVLVNNAGVIDTEVDLFASDPEQWWHTQEVNVLGAYLMTWLVAPHMLAAGGGRIVNVNSGAARRPGADASAYNVSKTALARVTGSTHLAGWARGIRAFDLMPGVVRTDMTAVDGRPRRPHRVDRPGRGHRPRAGPGVGRARRVVGALRARRHRHGAVAEGSGRRPAWPRTSAPWSSPWASPTPSPDPTHLPIPTSTGTCGLVEVGSAVSAGRCRVRVHRVRNSV